LFRKMLHRASFRPAQQCRSFAKGRYSNANPLLWKDGDASAQVLKFSNVGLLKDIGQELAQKKDVKVQFPKEIKDGWRAKLAAALFNMGSKTGKHEAVKTEMHSILTAIHSSKKCADFFRYAPNPKDREKAAEGLFHQGGVSPLLIVIASEALRSGYLRDLEQVYDHYLEYLAQGTNELSGVVYSADQLDDKDMASVRAAIVKGMKSAQGANLKLKNVVDSTVLGGLRVQVGNQYVDMSLRKRLNALTSRQKNEEGDYFPLVIGQPEVTAAIYKLAQEDVAKAVAKK